MKVLDSTNLSVFVSYLKTKLNYTYQTILISGTTIKTVNSTSLLGSGDVSVQPTLVSGTNIKTVNGNSLLGSGDIAISGGSSLPSVTSSDNGKVLMVVDGVWAAAELNPANGESF